jgi:uncharacterized protein YdeI (YjbR/CyaY-like superfamily)
MNNPLYFQNRQEWREWLDEYFQTEKEIWLIYPKKSSKKERIVYNDAVEEALCFGWIDSTVKSYVEQSFVQRFTPRNPKSAYSQSNKERIRWLYAQNMIHPSIIEKIKFVIDEEFIFPKDIIDILRKDPEIWDNYNRFSEPYKRIRIAYIDSARSRPEEFSKRLKHFLSKTQNNKLIGGFGGIEKYY